MAETRERGKRMSALAVAVAVTLLAGCGGGSSGGDDDGGTPGGVAASFTSSGTSAATGLVRLSGGSASGDTLTVAVVVNGPTTDADVYSFAFDVVLEDTTIARFVGGSAVAGTALTPDAGQGLQVLAEQIGDRVVVGVTKTGGGAGDDLANGTAEVVRLSFKVLKAGQSAVYLAGAPGGSGPSALDSDGQAVGAISFDLADAYLVGR